MLECDAPVTRLSSCSIDRRASRFPHDPAEMELSGNHVVTSAADEQQCSDSEEDRDHGVEIAANVDRIAAQPFRVVGPSEQSSVDEATASELLAWIQKSEAVEIQSYIDEQWKQFRSTSCTDADLSESHRRAIWSRMCYYSHLCTYMKTRAPGNIVFESPHCLFDSMWAL